MNATFWRELDSALTHAARARPRRGCWSSPAPANISAPAWRWTCSAPGRADGRQQPRGPQRHGRTDPGPAGHLHQARDAALSRSSRPSRAAASVARSTWSPPAACATPRRRLLLHPGDQHRHGGRRGHAAAPAQADPRGGGARAGLHRPAPGRRARRSALGWSTGVRQPAATAGRCDAVPRARSPPAAGGDLGHQAGSTTPATIRWPTTRCSRWAAAIRHLEQPACARGRHGDEGEARREVPGTAATAGSLGKWPDSPPSGRLPLRPGRCAADPGAYCRAVRTFFGSGCG
jgi:hypothetical protein